MLPILLGTYFSSSENTFLFKYFEFMYATEGVVRLCFLILSSPAQDSAFAGGLSIKKAKYNY